MNANQNVYTLTQHSAPACEDEGLCGMNGDGPNIIRMGFKRMYALQCVVIEDADLHVVRSSDYPMFPDK